MNLKTTMDLVTQNSYEKRHMQSTIPTALVKEKEIKQEPIQKIHKKTTKQKHIHREINAKEKRLRILRTTKLDTTTQMPSKGGRMQKQP